MPTAPYEFPYEGVKEMLLVDKEFLTGLFYVMYDEITSTKTKKEELDKY